MYQAVTNGFWGDTNVVLRSRSPSAHGALLPKGPLIWERISGLIPSSFGQTNLPVVFGQSSTVTLMVKPNHHFDDKFLASKGSDY